jgi:hypothetical protein
VTVSEVGYTITTGVAMDKPGSPLDTGGPGKPTSPYLEQNNDLTKKLDGYLHDKQLVLLLRIRKIR